LTTPEVRAVLDLVANAGAMSRTIVNGNPYAAWSLGWARSPWRDLSHVVDLSPRFENVVGSFRNEGRRRIRQAQENGLVVATGAGTADYEAYYRVYQAALARWGRAAIFRTSLDCILSLRERFGDAMRLWLARKDGEVVGGTIAIYDRSRVYLWQASHLESGLKLGVAYLLQHDMMRDACNRGFSEYDMGCSGGRPNLIRYKESFRPRRQYFDRAVIGDGLVYGAAYRVRELISGRR
jgi:lipid II:glycine glycyltransferase (peptidoglycan interpeptide bridge formation enzyme)